MQITVTCYLYETNCGWLEHFAEVVGICLIPVFGFQGKIFIWDLHLNRLTVPVCFLFTVGLMPSFQCTMGLHEWNENEGFYKSQIVSIISHWRMSSDYNSLTVSEGNFKWFWIFTLLYKHRSCGIHFDTKNVILIGGESQRSRGDS